MSNICYNETKISKYLQQVIADLQKIKTESINRPAGLKSVQTEDIICWTNNLDHCMNKLCNIIEEFDMVLMTEDEKRWYDYDAEDPDYVPDIDYDTEDSLSK